LTLESYEDDQEKGKKRSIQKKKIRLKSQKEKPVCTHCRWREGKSYEKGLRPKRYQRWFPQPKGGKDCRSYGETKKGEKNRWQKVKKEAPAARPRGGKKSLAKA